MVKRLQTWLVALACFILLPAVQAQDNVDETLHITLEHAIEIALSENPTVIVAGKEVEVKKYARREAIGGLIPEVSIDASYSRALMKQKMAMDVEGESATFTVGTSNTYQGAVNVSLPIFAPALYRTINMSKEDMNLAVEKSRASKLDLVNEVTKAYMQILLAQDSYDVLLKSYEQAKANFEVVNSKFVHGKVSEYDNIRAEVQMRSLKPSVISAENGIKLAKMQLKVLMGMSNPFDIIIDGQLNDFEPLLYVDPIASKNSIDLSRNSDLKQLDISEKLLEQTVQLQRTNYYPTVSAAFDFSYLSMSEDFRIGHYRWFPSSSVGLNVSIPLFKASTSPKVKQSRIELAKLNHTRVNAQRQLTMQATSFLDNMEASAEQVDSNKESVRQAQKGREIARRMYEVGKGTILELNDSEVALTQAELAYNQSIYDYLIARTDLKKVLGADEYDNFAIDK